MKPYPAQGRRLIALLKRRPMTYREMLIASGSCCPWKRVAECLKPGQTVVKGRNAAGWTTWRVVQGRGAT